MQRDAQQFACEGLLDGLGGVAAIDMLEIVEDHALRYVASMPRRDGTIDEDNYPVLLSDSNTCKSDI